MSTWQLQAAKQRLSEVIRAAETGEPQIITRHGRGVAVVIEYEGYRKLTGEQEDFKQFLTTAPLTEGFPLPERATDIERELDLA